MRRCREAGRDGSLSWSGAESAAKTQEHTFVENVATVRNRHSTLSMSGRLRYVIRSGELFDRDDQR